MTCRPLTTWPVSETRGRRRDRFGTGFERTLDDLYRELVHLRCQRAVIELDITESDIRNDGWPRASARARTPRVVLSLLDSRHGPLRYPCDTYLDDTGGSSEAFHRVMRARETLSNYTGEAL